MSNTLLKSSIGKKLVMSITGLFLVLFLLFHATMNLVAAFSPESYDAVCAFLGANWYALAATMVLAAGFVVHILLSIAITLYNKQARGNEHYATVARHADVTWQSKNMLVLGIIVLGFLCLHMWQFWSKMQLVELMYGHDWAQYTDIDPTSGATLIAYYFSNPIFALCYLVWLGALWFHLTHGFWSAFQTLGWNNQIWLPRLRCAANIFATVVCLAFAAVVVVFYLKSILCAAPACC